MNKYRVTKSTTTMETFDVEAETEAAAISAASSAAGTIVGQNALWSVTLTEQGEDPLPLPDYCGFGVYTRRISASQADAASAAKRCADAGISWVSLMVEASDGYIVSESSLKLWAAEFMDAGLFVGVWSFPGDARAASTAASVSAANLLTDMARAVDATIVMLDIEKPYKGKPEQMRAMIDALCNRAPEGAWRGVVSYPVPSYHPDLDWAAFKSFDWGSPMFYESAQSPSLISKGLAEWGQYVPVVVPSLDGWSGTGAEGAARFKGDILRVCGEPPPVVPGAIVWSEAQMDDAKRAVTNEMSTVYGWPRP